MAASSTVEHHAQRRPERVRAPFTLDERYHGVLAREVRDGRAQPGPILSRLQEFPPCGGICWGAYAEASHEVHELISHPGGPWSIQKGRSHPHPRNHQHLWYGILSFLFVWGVKK